MAGPRAARRSGFTLVEIMIVVLIIGVLLAIAVPQFQKAGRKSKAASCVQNLKQIEGAKERWAMDNNRNAGDTPSMTDLQGVGLYIKNPPVCPSGGTYTIGNLNIQPVCNIGGTAGDAEAHLLP